jgi:hypothetical protein
MKRALWVLAITVALVLLCGPAMAQDKLPAVKSVTIGANREFIVNGKPFLPIMSWLQSPRIYSKLRGLNFNTFCGTGKPKEATDAAKAAGGYMIPGFSKDVVGHSHLLAWIHGDEPDMPRKQDDKSFKPRSDPSDVLAKYRQIKAADKSRPVLVTFTGAFMRESKGKYTDAQKQTIYPALIRACDVVGFDTYPIYGSGFPGHLNWPAYGVTRLRELAGPKRPIYAWIETSKGSKWMTYEKQPDVLPIHTRHEVWGAIIRGATVIGYFTHAWKPSFREFAPTAEMQAELKRLNGQLTRLAPDILAPVTKRRIQMTIEGGLQCHLKATERKGTLTIFAQNQDIGIDEKKAKQFQPIKPRGGKATFTVAGLKAGTKIEVIDENRTITATQGGFTDEFGKLAEHVYRIGM